MDLKNKPILLTAAGTRTGASIARYLLSQGAELYLSYYSNKQGIEESLREFPNAKAWGMQADLTDPDSVTNLVAQVKEKTDQLYGLINVVGDYHEAKVLDTSYDEFKKVITNNLDSVFLTCKAFHPLLKAAGNARIINFSYAWAEKAGAAKPFAYHISKMGVLSLSKTMAREWGSDKISVNIISPGTLENSIVKESENAADYIPQGRFGRYQDLHPTLKLILDPESLYLSGTNFILSGGYNL